MGKPVEEKTLSELERDIRRLDIAQGFNYAALVCAAAAFPVALVGGLSPLWVGLMAAWGILFAIAWAISATT